MAIKILSKNILDIDYETTLDNVINKVTINATDIVPLSQYKTNVYNNYFVAGDKWSSEIDYNDFKNEENSEYSDDNGLAYVYADIKPTYLDISGIAIEKLLENKYISKLYDGVDLNGNNNINYSVYYTETREYVRGIFNTNTKKITVGSYAVHVGSKENVGSLPNIVTINQAYSYDGYDYLLTAEAQIEDRTNLSKIKFDTSDYDYYVLPDNTSIIVLYSIVTNTFNGITIQRGDNVSISGIRTTYTPRKIELSINGDIIGIDLEDISEEYGNGNKPFIKKNNELIQTTNKFANVNANEFFSNGIIEDYKNGKSVAIIECTFSDYYDENGEKVIDLKGSKMAFDIDDIVIPYIPNNKNEDVAMSLYKDNTPKRFKVIGVKFSCKGVPRQTLTLLEY